MPLPTLITDLSLIAGSNYPDGGQSPNVLDDVQRAHAAFIAKLRDEKLDNAAISPLATGGTSTAYTLTPTPSVTTLTERVRFCVQFTLSNTTTTPTLSISGLAVKNLKVYNDTGAKTNPAVGAFAASMIADVIYDGTDYVVIDQLPQPIPAVPAVRQTILSGNVDSSGFSSFGGSTGATTVTTSTTLVATAANGVTNRTGTIVNPSWTGLSTNGTMFLGLTVNADGTCTPFVTTLAPVYQWGGTFSVTNNQRTFNIQAMQMQVGNGSTATQAFDVFVGEVTVAGGVVTAIVWYQLMGRYTSGWTATLPGGSSSVSRNHNIGTTFLRTKFHVRCLTAQASYIVGEIEEAPWRQSGASNSSVIVPTVQTRLAMRLSTGNTLAIGGFDPTNGGAFLMNTAFWEYELTAERTW
jgi:hypothetical protein